MRVALCLSGGLRNFKDTHHTFKNFIIDKYDTDVFFYGLENKEGIAQNTNDLVELYKPKKFCINTNKFYIDIPCKWPKPNSFYGFYNVLKCNDLKKEYENKNNFKYDLVIRSRTDLFWFRYLTDSEIELSKNNILTPREWSFNHINSWARFDGFAFGNSDLIDRYSDLYNRLEEYKHIEFSAEQLCGYHMHVNKIPTIECDRSVVFEYPTKSGEKHINPHQFIKYFDEQKNRHDF